jgi:pyroglutamyl-peptidase
MAACRRRVGLITGSMPFAGLASSPSLRLLEAFDPQRRPDLHIVLKPLPVSYGTLPRIIDDLVRDIRPDFVLSLGLALGSPVLRLESFAVNKADFAIADNEGQVPRGEMVEPEGPAARFATWDAPAITRALLAAGLPALTSHFAGTHLCNLTLFSFLGALDKQNRKAPCGFLHLPYLPEQVAQFLLEGSGTTDTAPRTLRDVPSMSLALQSEALNRVIDILAPPLPAAEG